MEETPQDKKEMILTVTLQEDNKIRVDGPINNEMLSLWLLEKARDVVKAYTVQANAPKIARPGGILNFARFKK